MKYMKGQVTSKLGAILLIIIILIILLGLIYTLSGKSGILLDRIKDMLTFGL